MKKYLYQRFNTIQTVKTLSEKYSSNALVQRITTLYLCSRS
ncbi:MAG TPA: hypothetical protein VFU62_08830 [Hanamia sp.]|nr:hypothetical protein [Hanamia sp.]